MREHLGTSAFVASSAGVTVTDVDGNVFYDLTGSYGVNIFGNDFYKECIAEAENARACARPGARSLPPRHHRQRAAALRDFRTRRSLVPHVRHRSRDAGGAARALPHPPLASGALSPAPITAGGATCSPASATRFRRTRPTRWPTCRERTLHVLRTRRDIACVLVNPLQALHPNANAPGDSALVDSSRSAQFRSRGLWRMAEGAARGLHRARHRADLRRGVRRLPSRRAAARRNISACAPTW